MPKGNGYATYDYLKHLSVETHFGFELMTDLSQLKLEQNFDSFVLELEICHDPFYGQAYHLMAENSSGFVCVSVYDCNFDSSFYKPGTKILVFNPFLRFGHNFSPFVKITQPENIIFLPAGVSYLSWQKSLGHSPQKLKELGNTFYQKAKFRRAI
jgi:hypothetical protein